MEAPISESWTTATEDQTQALGRRLARELAPDGVLLLTGDLGAGKTVLTRGVAEGLGIAPREIQSPTFTLMREHTSQERPVQERPVLVHLDLYRLEPEETWELGLDEVFAGPGVKVVEWAERLPDEIAGSLPGALRLELLRRAGGGREIRRLASHSGTHSDKMGLV